MDAARRNMSSLLFSSVLQVPCMCKCACGYVRLLVCVRVCERMCMHAHICVGNDAKDVEWYIAVYLGNLVGFHQSSVFFVDPDVCLLRVQGSRQFVWQTHFYITLQHLSLAVMQAVHLDNPVADPTSYPEKWWQTWSWTSHPFSFSPIKSTETQLCEGWPAST